MATWSIPGVLSRTYGRDANGNITTIDSTAGSASYGYDALDRLVAEPGQAFTWDPNGNRLGDARGVYAYAPASNRMTAEPAGAVELDAAGNTTALGDRSYRYDATGRLAEVRKAGGTQATYRYREDGLRSSRTAGGVTTQFLYDPSGRLLAERSPTRSRDFVWDDEGRPVAMIEGSTITYLHADHLGTPRRGTDAAGTVTWAWDGEAFGASAPSIAAVDVPLRFPGQILDADTGLVFNGWRTYVPQWGRYLESDPVGVVAGVNSYSYVGGNPILNSDPLGLDWLDTASDVSAGFGDTISFGVTRWIRNQMGTNNAVDLCSSAYAVGSFAGVGYGFISGGFAGWSSAGGKSVGIEFSHWIPSRFGGPRSKWNGNYVPTIVHALSDPYRYRFMPRTWKAENPLPSPLQQQWRRFPDVYKGAAAGGSISSAAPLLSDCTCR